MRFEALFPLRPIYRDDSSFYADIFLRMLDYFKTDRQFILKRGDYLGGNTLTVRAESCSASLKRRLFRDKMIVGNDDSLLRFRGDFNFPGMDKFYLTDGDGKKRNDTSDELYSFWESAVPSLLDDHIQTFICALMLAFPGAAQTVANVWLADDKRHPFSSYYISSLHDSIEYLVQNNIKPRNDVDPDKVIKWVFSQNGVVDGISDTPAGRSFNYFTRLFVRKFRDDELSDLVWALAGIEGLLVEGGRSSVGQLREKLGAIFGLDSSPSWLLNSTERMYKFRSKIIHGNRQLRSTFRTDDLEMDKRFDEEYDSQRFSVGILFLLLQEVISRGITEFKFKMVEA